MNSVGRQRSTRRSTSSIGACLATNGSRASSQAAKQKAFLTMVMGGPHNYTGKDMRTAHAPLLSKGLNDTHVDVVIEHLGGVLKELGASDAQIAQVAALANSVRNDVLSRPQA